MKRSLANVLISNVNIGKNIENEELEEKLLAKKRWIRNNEPTSAENYLKSQELSKELNLNMLIEYLNSKDQKAVQVALEAFSIRIFSENRPNNSVSEQKTNEILKDSEDVKINREIDEEERPILCAVPVNELKKDSLLKLYLENFPECEELIKIFKNILKKQNPKNDYVCAILKTLCYVIRFNIWPQLIHITRKLSRLMIRSYLADISQFLAVPELIENTSNLLKSLVLVSVQHAREFFANFNFSQATLLKAMNRRNEYHEHIHRFGLSFLKIGDGILIQDFLSLKFAEKLLRNIHMEKSHLSESVMALFITEVLRKPGVSKSAKIKYFNKKILMDIARVIIRPYQYSVASSKIVNNSSLAHRFLQLLWTNPVVGIIIPCYAQPWTANISVLPSVKMPLNKNTETLDPENTRSRNKFYEAINILQPTKDSNQEKLILSTLSIDMTLYREYLDKFQASLLPVEVNSLWMSRVTWSMQILNLPTDFDGILQLILTGDYSIEHISNWIVPPSICSVLSPALQHQHTAVVYVALNLFLKVFQVIQKWKNKIQLYSNPNSYLIHQLENELLPNIRRSLPEFRTVVNQFIRLGSPSLWTTENPPSDFPISISVEISDLYPMILQVFEYYLRHYPEVYNESRFDFGHLFDHSQWSITPSAAPHLLSLLELALPKLQWNKFIPGKKLHTQLTMLLRFATQVPADLQSDARHLVDILLQKSSLFDRVEHETKWWVQRLTAQPAVLDYLERALNYLIRHISTYVDIMEEVVWSQQSKYASKWNLEPYVRSTDTLPFSALVLCILCHHKELVQDLELSSKLQVLAYIVATLTDILHSQTHPLPFVLAILRNKHLCIDQSIRNFVRFIKEQFALEPQTQPSKIFTDGLLDANQVAFANIQVSIWDAFDLIKPYGGLDALSARNLLVHFFMSRFLSTGQQKKVCEMVLPKLIERPQDTLICVQVLLFQLTLRLERSKIRNEQKYIKLKKLLTPFIFDFLIEITTKVPFHTNALYPAIVKTIYEHPITNKYFLSEDLDTNIKLAKILVATLKNKTESNETIDAFLLTREIMKKLFQMLRNLLGKSGSDTLSLSHIIEVTLTLLPIFMLSDLIELTHLLLEKTHIESSSELCELLAQTLLYQGESVIFVSSLPSWIMNSLYEIDPQNHRVKTRIIDLKSFKKLLEIRPLISFECNKVIDKCIFDNIMRSEGVGQSYDTITVDMKEHLSSKYFKKILVRPTIYQAALVSFYWEKCRKMSVFKDFCSEVLSLEPFGKDHLCRNLEDINVDSIIKEAAPYLSSLLFASLFIVDGNYDLAISLLAPFRYLIIYYIIVSSSDSFEGSIIYDYGIPSFINCLEHEKYKVINLFTKTEYNQLEKKLEDILSDDEPVSSLLWSLYSILNDNIEKLKKNFLHQYNLIIEDDRRDPHSQIKVNLKECDDDVVDTGKGGDTRDNTDADENNDEIVTKNVLKNSSRITLKKLLDGIEIFKSSIKTTEDANRILKTLLKKGFNNELVLKALKRLLIDMGDSPSEIIETSINLIYSHSFFLHILMKDENENLQFTLIDLLLTLYNQLPSSSSLFNNKNLGLFLAVYDGTLNPKSQLLLQMIQLFEFNKVSISDSGFLWGHTAQEHRVSALQRGQSPIANLETAESLFFDGQLLELPIVLKTLNSFPAFLSLVSPLKNVTPKDFWGHEYHFIEFNDQNFNSQSEKIYDLRFIIPFFYLATKFFSFDCKKFVQNGALSLVFMSLSCEDLLLRQVAYATLSSFSSFLETSNFPEATSLRWLLQILQADIFSPSPMVPGIHSSFLAQVSFILARPDHSLYVFIENYLTSKPILDLSKIPIWNTFVLIGTNAAPQARQWLFKTIATGINRSSDLNLLSTDKISFLFSSLSSSMLSSYSSYSERLRIWKILARIIVFDTPGSQYSLESGVLTFLAHWTSSFHEATSIDGIELIPAASIASINIYAEFLYLWDLISQIETVNNKTYYWTQVFSIISNVTLYLELVLSMSESNYNNSNNLVQRQQDILKKFLVPTIKILEKFANSTFSIPFKLLKTLIRQVGIIIWNYSADNRNKKLRKSHELHRITSSRIESNTNTKSNEKSYIAVNYKKINERKGLARRLNFLIAVSISKFSPNIISHYEQSSMSDGIPISSGTKIFFESSMEDQADLLIFAIETFLINGKESLPYIKKLFAIIKNFNNISTKKSSKEIFLASLPSSESRLCSIISENRKFSKFETENSM